MFSLIKRQFLTLIQVFRSPQNDSAFFISGGFYFFAERLCSLWRLHSRAKNSIQLLPVVDCRKLAILVIFLVCQL